jgi:hypothetical protein
MNERAEQRLVARRVAGLDQDPRVKAVHVWWAVVCQPVRLEVSPPVLVRIEFGGVAGQELQVQASATAQPVTQGSAAVGAEVIPHHDDAPAQMPEQVAQESDDLLLADALVPMELQIPSQMTAARRDREAADGRDAPVVAGALPQDGCLAPWRPGTANHGMQQEARFINENQVGVPTGRPAFDPRPIPFDPAADGFFVAFNGQPFGPLRGKNRAQPSPEEWRRRGTRCPNAGESTRRSGGRSRGPWQTRNRTLLSEGRPPRPASAAPSVSKDGRAPAGQPGPRLRLADAAAARRRRSAAWSSGGGRSRRGRTRGPSGPRPVAADAPTAPGFRGVSCFITSAFGPNKLYYYWSQ